MHPYRAEREFPERQQTVVVAGPLSDDQLAYAYLRWKEEMILGSIFYERPEDWSLSAFLAWHRAPGNHHLGCFIAESGTDILRLAGIGWINSITDVGTALRKAEVGLGFFRSFQDVWFPREATKLLLDYIFGTAGITAIFGTTPVQNKPALRFSRRMGFDLIGPVEDYTVWRGNPSAVMISHMAKKQWEQRVS